jgi:hypothetical protein
LVSVRIISFLKEAQMFYLSRFEHTFRMPPSLLSLPGEEAVKGELERLFLDKVSSMVFSSHCFSYWDQSTIVDIIWKALFLLCWRLLQHWVFVSPSMISAPLKVALSVPVMALRPIRYAWWILYLLLHKA